MLIAALIVGGLTAWYLGINWGIAAAAISAAALLAAMVVPGLGITVYVLLAGWCALLYFFGAKVKSFAKPKAPMSDGWKAQAAKWALKAKSFLK